MATVNEIFDDASGDLAIGDLEAAVEKYRRCVELDPDFFDGWHAFGMALMKLGRFAEARAELEKATALRPKNGEAWALLGNVYKDSNEPEKGAAALCRS